LARDRAASFAAMIKGSIDAADEINKLSQKIGISVEALSTLRFAAELSDVSLDTLRIGIKKLSQGITEASTGTGKAAEVFAALGIEVKTATGALVPTETVLLKVAEVFAGLEDGAVKSALAVELFGRSGLDLIPFLNQGADGIAASRPRRSGSGSSSPRRPPRRPSNSTTTSPPSSSPPPP
jgi:ribosomal protein L12E/L44/L45/RPP1/RPP2